MSDQLMSEVTVKEKEDGNISNRQEENVTRSVYCIYRSSKKHDPFQQCEVRLKQLKKLLPDGNKYAYYAESNTSRGLVEKMLTDDNHVFQFNQDLECDVILKPIDGKYTYSFSHLSVHNSCVCVESFFFLSYFSFFQCERKYKIRR